MHTPSVGGMRVQVLFGTYSAEAAPNTEHRTSNVEQEAVLIRRSMLGVRCSMFALARLTRRRAKRTPGLAVCVRLSTPAAAARTWAWSRFGALAHRNGCLTGGGFW